MQGPRLQGRPGILAQHDVVCREAASLSRSLLSEKQDFIRSARANFAGILHANPSLRFFQKKLGGVASELDGWTKCRSLHLCLQQTIIALGQTDSVLFTLFDVI